MCYDSTNAHTLNTIVEVSELFQEFLKLAADDKLIESWCLEIRLQETREEFIWPNDTQDNSINYLLGLHSLNSLLSKILEEQSHETCDSCHCGWEVSQVPEFQHTDINSYTPGTIIRWAEGECHVLLAPSSSYEAEIKTESDKDDINNVSEDNVNEHLRSGVIQCTNKEDHDSVHSDETEQDPETKETTERSNVIVEKQQTLDTLEEKDIEENIFDQYKNSIWSSNQIGSEDDDEDNSQMLVINEDGADDNTTDEGNEGSLGFHFAAQIKPLTVDNVAAHDNKSPSIFHKVDNDESSSVSSTTSSSSSSTSSSSSSSSSDDDDRINFKKRVEQAAQAVREAEAANAISTHKTATEKVQVTPPQIDAPSLSVDRHPDDIQAAQVLSALGKSPETSESLSTTQNDVPVIEDNVKKLHSGVSVYKLAQKLLQDKNISVRRLGNQRFQCGMCGKMYNRIAKVFDHYFTHLGETPFKCNTCDKVFRNPYTLQKHKRQKHLPLHLQQHSCNICHKNFDVASRLQMHMASHATAKPFACTICGQTYALKFTRDTHQAQHTGNRPWTCNVCGRSYITKYKLKSHMKAHTGQLNCTLCNKQLGSQDALTRHVKGHKDKTKSTPKKSLNKKLSSVSKASTSTEVDAKFSEFRCQMCNKIFAKSAILTHHLASCNAITYCPPTPSIQQQQLLLDPFIDSNKKLGSSAPPYSESMIGDHLDLVERPFLLNQIQSDNPFQQIPSTNNRSLPDYLNEVAFGENSSTIYQSDQT